MLEKPDGCEIKFKIGKKTFKDSLTVKGVPLVCVETQGHLGDGHEVILLHLPLQAGLLTRKHDNW